MGLVDASISRELKGRIINATISQEPSGRYFVSIGCSDIPIEPNVKTGKSIGIDLGIKEFITTSDGKQVKKSKIS